VETVLIWNDPTNHTLQAHPANLLPP
jgi:hypothetical protein